MINSFEYAQYISEVAVSLDNDKITFPDDAKRIAETCVEQLHLLAVTLAGEQAGDIYSEA